MNILSWKHKVNFIFRILMIAEIFLTYNLK
jgi:hypothetical protein